MSNEIERKFIVDQAYHDMFLNRVPESHLIQMYLNKSPTVRVTHETHLGKEVGWLAVKGAPSQNGLVRSEWEYEIPADDAKAMIEELGSRSQKIEKVRHEIQIGNDTWEVDVLPCGARYLVIAEIEKPTVEEVNAVELPHWIEREVTGNHAFSMVNIAQLGGLSIAWNAAYIWKD
jgi:adenylate cyclase